MPYIFVFFFGLCLATPNTKLTLASYSLQGTGQFHLRAKQLYHQKTPSKSNIRLQGRVSEATFLKRLELYDITVKKGVILKNMNLGLYRSLGSIKKAFGSLPIHITSGRDGHTHKKGKRSHYQGFKLDFSVKHWPLIRIKNNKVFSGKEIIFVVLDNLNQIHGIKAIYEEGKNFPHIDIQYTTGKY